MPKREDLTVIWNREKDIRKRTLVMKGEVFLSTDPAWKEPRMVAEIRIPYGVLEDGKATFGALIALCEERFGVDLQEINGEGAFTDVEPDEELKTLRVRLAA